MIGSCVEHDLLEERLVAAPRQNLVVEQCQLALNTAIESGFRSSSDCSMVLALISFMVFQFSGGNRNVLENPVPVCIIP